MTKPTIVLVGHIMLDDLWPAFADYLTTSIDTLAN